MKLHDSHTAGRAKLSIPLYLTALKSSASTRGKATPLASGSIMEMTKKEYLGVFVEEDIFFECTLA